MWPIRLIGGRKILPKRQPQILSLLRHTPRLEVLDINFNTWKNTLRSKGKLTRTARLIPHLRTLSCGFMSPDQLYSMDDYILNVVHFLKLLPLVSSWEFWQWQVGDLDLLDLQNLTYIDAHKCRLGSLKSNSLRQVHARNLHPGINVQSLLHDCPALEVLTLDGHVLDYPLVSTRLRVLRVKCIGLESALVGCTVLETLELDRQQGTVLPRCLSIRNLKIHFAINIHRLLASCLIRHLSLLDLPTSLLYRPHVLPPGLLYLRVAGLDVEYPLSQKALNVASDTTFIYILTPDSETMRDYDHMPVSDFWRRIRRAWPFKSSI
ncbi:hypothetical protein SARC_05458 [Sphaeroforma arctica JP610]|uniref:F-box domain-containing protein n=1 Tax=Sphaeroforma arctica JP610 TaxID=667725 RepID=A0A0L0G092_9EUKA|nr:hypothetical protein SARC_05458 [Sphaeroforma arctica JP610]KNC82251.1 hypothetical protein SARC_05458 [Sphaeroforma arctica JP610]|eukprot:XP_014156153.1 hypothetical protein SARC_05458 [Sphaeroforma arctica JP610]